MERNYYTEGFENFLKEKTDEYKLYPSEKVWNNIQQSLHPRRKWPFITAALLLLGIGIGTKLAIDDWNLSPLTTIDNTNIPADKNHDLSGQAPENAVNSATSQQAAGSLSSTRIATIRPILGSNPPVMEKTERNPMSSLEMNPNINYNRAILDEQEKTDVINKRNFQVENATRPTAKVISLMNSNPVNNNGFEAGKENLISNKLNELLTEIVKVKKKTVWQLYFAPTVSYRKLIGQASKSNYSYNGILYSANLGYPSDVNDAVTHKPSLGFELGTAFIYPMSRSFRVKAGLQLNFHNYQVEAYNYIPEIASYGVGNYSQPINAVSYYRNFNGFSRTWLRNSHVMISVPLGFELKIVGNRKVSFNIASTIQPTYVINNQSYLVSTNLKNYAQEPSLYRKWNVNTGAEAFVAIKSGSIQWVIGPQFRYQLLSSYKDKYPIQEHLLDFGFKVGINKTLK